MAKEQTYLRQKSIKLANTVLSMHSGIKAYRSDILMQLHKMLRINHGYQGDLPLKPADVDGSQLPRSVYTYAIGLTKQYHDSANHAHQLTDAAAGAQMLLDLSEGITDTNLLHKTALELFQQAQELYRKIYEELG